MSLVFPSTDSSNRGLKLVQPATSLMQDSRKRATIADRASNECVGSIISSTATQFQFLLTAFIANAARLLRNHRAIQFFRTGARLAAANVAAHRAFSRERASAI